jgi:hypothetical protein
MAQIPSKRHASSSSPESATPGEDSCPMFLGAPPVSTAAAPVPAYPGFVPALGFGDAQSDATHLGSPLVSLQVLRNPFSAGVDASSFALASPLAAQAPPASSLEDRCFDAFYHYFHAGHPFVLPREYFLRFLKDATPNIEHLITAMRYMGSLYLNAGPARATFLEQAIRLCHLPSTPKDGFLIQALLMLVVGLDGSCEQARARELLSQCERLALEINLNTRQFASLHGGGNPMLEESWRRTWWELYVCDGMIAGVHQVTNFALFDIDADVGLPCEELQYATGVCPPPLSPPPLDPLGRPACCLFETS